GVLLLAFPLAGGADLDRALGCHAAAAGASGGVVAGVLRGSPADRGARPDSLGPAVRRDRAGPPSAQEDHPASGDVRYLRHRCVRDHLRVALWVLITGIERIDMTEGSADEVRQAAGATITPLDIQQKEFRVSRFGGYRMRD